MIEVAVVIDLKGAPIYWHLPEGRTGGSIPDSRNLWQILWENRDKISAVAHSHPGRGNPGPSVTDITTFTAIEAALGKRFVWYICSEDGFSYSHAKGNGYLTLPYYHEPAWLPELRRLSYGGVT